MSTVQQKEQVDLLESLELARERDRLAMTMGLSTTNPLPSSPDIAKKVDEILEQELQRLSILEKEQMMFAVHGIAHDQKDPDDMDALLKLLESEIEMIPDKDAYEKAKNLKEEYVMDRDFRLSFLRCDNYNVKVAAQRLVKHFEVKKDWFGMGPLLARDINISDLSEESLEALKAGIFQLLPVRDLAGRLIVFISPFLANESISDHALVSWNKVNVSFLVIHSMYPLTYYSLSHPCLSEIVKYQDMRRVLFLYDPGQRHRCSEKGICDGFMVVWHVSPTSTKNLLLDYDFEIGSTSSSPKIDGVPCLL